jgi:hypothetical protein
MSNNGYSKADQMRHEAESSRKSDRRNAWLASVTVVALVLLAAPLAYAAPAGSNGNDPHAFKVIDKNGTLVGYTVTENMVARQIDTVWVTFYVHPAVGIYDSGAIYLNYLTTDCTGTGYITHYSTFSEGTRVGSKLYYPKDQQQLTPRSVRVASANADGACYPASDIAGVYGVATTVDVNSFGFELPFKAQQ